MGCHTHCAICGVAFGGKYLAYFRRSEKFKLHKGQKHLDHDEKRQCRYCDGSYDEVDEWGCVEDMEEWDNEHGYDPGILNDEDLRWSNIVQVLGLNDDILGLRKAFMSGEGHCNEEYGAAVARGSHMNSPNRLSFSCYTVFDVDDKPVYPFHPQCYNLLKIVAKTDLKLDYLYEIFRNLRVDRQSFRDISYGSPSQPHDQYWLCRPGDEILVSNPEIRQNPDDVFDVGSRLISDRYYEPLDLDDKVLHDPFDRLPSEIIQQLMDYLPFKSTFSLIQASWPVSTSCNSSEFWAQQIRRKLPWAWELHEALSRRCIRCWEGKQLLLCLEAITTPRRWLEGVLLPIANRRRIWNTCEQFIDLYDKHVYRLKRVPISQSVQDVLDQAEVLQMPPISYFEEPGPIETMTSIWLCDLVDLHNESFLLETFWREDALVGISISTLMRTELFGFATRVVESATVDGSDWVGGIVLFVSDPVPLSTSTISTIEGLDIVCRSGRTISFGTIPDNSSQLCQRALTVSDGRYMVGITGQLAQNQIIRLGLVQCSLPLQDTASPQPSEDTSPTTQLPQIEKHLWQSSLKRELGQDIWKAPNFELIEVDSPGFRFRPSPFPDSLVPRHPILFGRSIDDLENLTKIRAFSPPAGLVKVLGARNDGITTYRLAGISTERTVSGRIYTTHTGYNVNPGAGPLDKWSIYSRTPAWDPRFVQTFRIDGPGGEAITEVTVVRRGVTTYSLRLRTNRERFAFFGDRERPGSWSRSITAPAGRAIIGVCLGFGDIGGQIVEWHDSKLKRFVSTVSVLTIER